MKKYKVLWPHVGDKEYGIGDTRIAVPAIVAHLVVPVGTMLEELGDADDEAAETTGTVGLAADVVDAARREVAESAQRYIDELKQQHSDEMALRDENAEQSAKALSVEIERADAAEKAAFELQGKVDDLTAQLAAKAAAPTEQAADPAAGPSLEEKQAEDADSKKAADPKNKAR